LWWCDSGVALSTQFAKLEQNIIITFFLATFDYELTDRAGSPPAETPSMGFNGHAAAKPSPPVYLKYTQRV
jgi:hypothetical protein